MTLRAAFFDVGDTLVEHWAPREVMNERARAQICAGIGDQPWLDELLDASLEPGWYVEADASARAGFWRFEPERARQETEHWYREWFQKRGIEVDGIDLDRLRSLMCVPLDEISTPVRGAFDAVRWCADQGLRVVLVTNTLSRGDAEALEDWRRFGLADAIEGVVSSHSAGWRKPHPAIFERALAMADAGPTEAFHVGDNLIADVWGAQQLGIRGVWRRLLRAPRPDDVAAAPDPGDRDHPKCEHWSQDLTLRSGDVVCTRCGALAGIDIRPDAVVDDLIELPAIVAPWIP